MAQFTDEQKTVIATLAAEGVIALAEFRGEKPEIIPYIDRSTGHKRYIVKHNIALEYLGSGEQVPAELYAPRAPDGRRDKDGKMVEDMPEPELPEKTGLRKGDLLIVCIGSFFVKQGNTNCKIKSITRMDTLKELAINSDEPAPGAKEYKLNPKPAKQGA